MTATRSRRALTGLVVLGVVLCGVVAWKVPAANWRVRVVGMKLGGELDGLDWRPLLSMLKPRSPYELEQVLDDRDVYLAIQNPYRTPEDVQAGAAIFRERCAACHGSNAKGETGPDLTTGVFRRGAADWALYQTIQRGVPGTPMPPHKLSERLTWSTVSFLRSLSVVGLGDSIAGVAAAPEVTAERIAGGLQNGEWLTYSGSYDGRRHSPLSQINRSNVGDLRFEWAFQLPLRFEAVETAPIVAGETMFLTGTANGVFAVDTKTGNLIWSFDRAPPRRVIACCGYINRGLGIRGNTLYLGTIDAHLIALDARTGKVLWDVVVGDHASGYSITGAPLVVGNKVITGVGGGSFGIRGFIAAFDAESGDKVWHFDAIPGPGQPGNETWEGDSWKTGGAGTWLTGTYDPALNMLYWGVGNPGPLFNGEMRRGDNLYANSVVALDAETGKLRWHFQFTPHDVRDWDAVQIPVLFDAELEGVTTKLMGWANRNGFYYVLNRETGRFIRARPFVRQNWAQGMDSIGRPILAEGSRSSEQGVLTYPAKPGATNWWSPSFSPITGLFYIPTKESGAIFTRAPAVYRRGEHFLGGGAEAIDQRTFSIRAVDALTGEQRWVYQPTPRASGETRRAGVLSTAGGLVVTADETSLVVLDDATGRALWTKNLGGAIVAAPTTYLVGGRQRIAIASGRTIYTFGVN